MSNCRVPEPLCNEAGVDGMVAAESSLPTEVTVDIVAPEYLRNEVDVDMLAETSPTEQEGPTSSDTQANTRGRYGLGKKAARKAAAATSPGVEYIREGDSPAPRGSSSITTPLRGLAKNREQAMNAPPSLPAKGLRRAIIVDGPPSVPKKGLRTNNLPSHSTNAKESAHNEGLVDATSISSSPASTVLRGLAKNRGEEYVHAMHLQEYYKGTTSSDSPPPAMPALQRATEREYLLPQTQPGAVQVSPTHLHLDSARGSELRENVSEQEVPEEVFSNGPPNRSPCEAFVPPGRSSAASAPSPITRSNTGLAVAKPVEDDTGGSLTEAQEVDSVELQSQYIKEEKEIKCRRAGIAIGAITVICCIVLAIILALKLGRKEAAPSTVAPTIISLENHVLSLLPAYTQETIHGDASSPQSNSYNWLIADPNLRIYSDKRIIQRIALGTLFFATKGGAWRSNTNWMSYDEHECEWHAEDAVQVVRNIYRLSGEPIPEALLINLINRYSNASFPCEEGPMVEQEYSHLLLIANGLQGYIPPEVYLLTSLKTIVLNFNQLAGPGLSTEVGKLSLLETFILGSNKLIGTIPTEIGLASSLGTLMLRENNMIGTIPTEFGLLSDTMKMLDLAVNQISGSIPKSLFSLQEMNHLSLFSNQLSGTIPTNLGVLSSDLMWLDSHS